MRFVSKLSENIKMSLNFRELCHHEGYFFSKKVRVGVEHIKWFFEMIFHILFIDITFIHQDAQSYIFLWIIMRLSCASAKESLLENYINFIHFLLLYLFSFFPTIAAMKVKLWHGLFFIIFMISSSRSCSRCDSHCYFHKKEVSYERETN